MRGERQLSLRLVGEPSIADHIDGIYRAFQEAVEEFGGAVPLAASMEKPLSGVCLKVGHRADSKGDLQKATLDMLGHLGPDPRARLAFMAALSELWSLEPPKPKRIASEHELYEALVAEVEEANGVGKSLIERAARRAGVDSGAFRRR